MSTILSGLEGVLCMVDDVLITGATQAEHDQRLTDALERIQKAGVTLNKEKCEFSKDKVTYLGQVISAAGVQPDPEKVKAIVEMKEPEDTSDVKRFLGMVNQLGKFSDKLSDLSKPLRELVSPKNDWHWGQAQAEAFVAIKEELSKPGAILAHYNAKFDTVVSADASSYGLGAVLLQKQPNDQWRPVAYHSRALTETEQRYAPIEKESLAATWACERFSDYLVGKSFHIQTDHKPLVPLLGTKEIDSLPPRTQRFRMQLMRFHFTIEHVPGKDLYTADALSRAPLSDMTPADLKLQDDVYLFVNHVIESLPASEMRREEIRKHQEEDDICREIVLFCQKGWPEKSQLKGPLKLYQPYAAELTVQNGLLLKGCQLVIPLSMRMEMLDRIHTGHQGITKCRARARQAVWWPGMSRQIEELVQNCAECRKLHQHRAEPMVPSSLPQYPWQKVATDLFQFKNHQYLLVIDYYSRYIELAQLSSTTSPAIINHLKSIFSRHGIPERFVSDNGPQYTSSDFASFAHEYGFHHVTSSPRYPQANGEAERAVATVKSTLEKSKDPYLAMLVYRSTPLQHGFSPAEMLMGRRLRTTLPSTKEMMKPSVPDPGAVKLKDEAIKERQVHDFNKHHGAHKLPPLEKGDKVWVKDQNREGVVAQKIEHRRSYEVTTPQGQVRRNRKHLVTLPETTIPAPQLAEGTTTEVKPEVKEATPSDRVPVAKEATPSDRVPVTTRSGREVKLPARFRE